MKPFEITDEAKNQIEKLLEKNPGKYAVSLAVLGGGCAGFLAAVFFLILMTLAIIAGRFLGLLL